MSDRLCDGLGACLGHCPQGAIAVERREAAEFDEAAVTQHLAATKPAPTAQTPTRLPTRQPAPAAHGGGCPGSRMMQFGRSAAMTLSAADAAPSAPSELTHWPVQINLLPPQAPVLHQARVLVAADCVPVAYADFHAKLLHGRVVLIGCPKFDDVAGYVERFAEIIRLNELREIVVARMEVPCCSGMLMAVLEGRRRAGVPVAVVDAVIGTRGALLSEREVPL